MYEWLMGQSVAAIGGLSGLIGGGLWWLLIFITRWWRYSGCKAKMVQGGKVVDEIELDMATAESWFKSLWSRKLGLKSFSADGGSFLNINVLKISHYDGQQRAFIIRFDENPKQERKPDEILITVRELLAEAKAEHAAKEAAAFKEVAAEQGRQVLLARIDGLEASQRELRRLLEIRGLEGRGQRELLAHLERIMARLLAEWEGTTASSSNGQGGQAAPETFADLAR